MKVGIVVPFSWSFWGAVLEHAELKSEALRARGHEVKIVIGNDPPGTFTRALHPRHGRHDDPPPDVIPVGRTVIVPANGSLPNICLSPSVPFKLKRVFAEETFDVIHLQGHTPGSVALALVGADEATHLFTGDCLFPGGVGKTWKDGDFEKLLGDVTTRVFDVYGDSTVVYPGHGDDTTLGTERPHLDEWKERGW